MKTCLFLIALIPTLVWAQPRNKRFQYEKVGFEDMIQRYLHRDGSPVEAVEGIYSVSCIILKTKRHWLTGQEIVRVVQRKDNYARVAIVKETMNTNRDFIEVSLSFKDATLYPIVGDLTALADGSGYVYKHIEPKGEILSFSMLLTHSDLLEGQFSQSHGRKIITTKLSYFKLYPKVQDKEETLTKNKTGTN
ncbi:MAG: hypothetical protein O9340_05840 [Cyclobacteriaceae bacterium]|jgi:hypothetical protein|nr:hypothetical protein [Cyclobacteriaceae bacterium]